MSRAGECLDEESALSYFSGKLSPERRVEIERHIEGCDACDELLQAMARMREGGLSVEDANPALRLSAIKERYRVLGEHARGGQARILLAFDEKVGREVALKEMLPVSADSADRPSWRDAMARFLREAELTGQLAHPGVVPVFDIGSWPDGTLYYTMQLVRGRTLSEVLRERPQLQDRLGLLGHFVSVCQVVAFAHSRGVIHRDIKPQNVMVGEFGETVLLDWGLAKQKGDKPGTVPLPARPSVAAPDATRSGAIIGTPGYMSPEQASGKLEEVDERADVYGLGAVLFEILTGKSLGRIWEQNGEPQQVAAVPPVRSLCAEVPPDLAVIVEKALAPNKGDRYEQASELAKEVTAFMTGGRVAAYSYTSRDLLRRFASRYRVLLVAAGVTLAAIVAALVITSLAWRSELTSRRAAAAQGQEALQEGAKLALSQGDVLQARAKLRGALELGDSLTARALWRKLRVTPERFVANFSSMAFSVRFSPDGHELAVGLQDASVQRLDIVTRAARILRGGEDQIYSVAYSPDGHFLAAGSSSGDVTLWDLESGELMHFGGLDKLIRGIGFSPDGSLLFAGDARGRIAQWNTLSRAVGIEQMPIENLRGVAFSSDGRWVAMSSEEGRIFVRDLQAQHPIELSGPCNKLTLGPDGSLLIGGGLDGNVYLWQHVGDGQPPRLLRGHQQRVINVALSHDARLVASASADGTLRLWSLPEGREIRVIDAGKDVVFNMAFNSDGTLLAAALGKSVRIWDLRTPEEPMTLQRAMGAIDVARFAPDGAQIVSGSYEGVIARWDPSSGELLASWAGQQSWVMDICFSRDGKLLASAGGDGVLSIWDVLTGTVNRRFPGGSSLTAVACSPNNRDFASGQVDGTIQIYDSARGRLERTLNPGAKRTMVCSLRYSADGHRLIASYRSGGIEVWDLASRGLLRVFAANASSFGLRLDVMGNTLASGSDDHSVRLWNLTDGTSQLLGETSGRVYGLGWSPRGERLAAPTATGEVYVWSVAGGAPIRFAAHHSEVNNIEFSPSGETAVSAGDDGTVRLWDTKTWRPKWFTRALVYDPAPQILTHLGWLAAESSGQIKPTISTGHAWRRAVEDAREANALPGGPVCVVSADGFEAWDMTSDTCVLSERVAQPFDVAAVPGGCSLLKEGRVTLLRPGKPSTEIARGVGGQSGGEELVAIGSGIELFDREGRILGRFGSGSGVTAAAPIGDRMAVGFRDGGIELRSQGVEPSLSLQDTPRGAATRIVKGPNGTLAAGFADGSFGVWNLSSGARLERGAVHGAVRHLIMHGQLLIVASEMGATASMDLSGLTTDYCDLLREVWSRVPVLWRDEGAVVREPDRGHRCASR